MQHQEKLILRLFMEIYGQNIMVKLAHQRRDLNVCGLDALDLRTRKPNGEPWDFRKKSDQNMLRGSFENDNPSG